MSAEYAESIRPAIRRLVDSLDGLVAAYAAGQKSVTIQEQIALLYQTRKSRETLLALELLMLAALQLREIEAAADIQKNSGIDMTLAKKYLAQLDDQREHLQALILELPTSESLHGLVRRVLPDAELDAPKE